MRVPGALAAVAGVSMVGVLPSHRRRGILSSLMGQQLDDVHERGEAVAALFASEAGDLRQVRLRARVLAGWLQPAGRRGRAGGGAPADEALRLRIAEPGAARAGLAKVYEAVLGERPGFYARNEAWWDRALADDPDKRAGASPLRCVLAEDTAGPRGYALFSGRERWDQDALLAEFAIEVREVITADPAATAAIWGNLLSRDLTTEFHVPMRPVDDPLLHLLADPRRVRSRITDALWVRLVDVAGALAQRRYACPVDVVIEVTDHGCSWNRGRWRLTTGAGRPTGSGHRRGGIPRHLRADQRPGRYLAARAGAGGRLPRGDPAGADGGGRPGRRAAAGHPGLPVGRTVLGPGPLVPDDVLSAGSPPARRSRSGAGPVAAKPASLASMSSLRRPGRPALSTGWVWPSGRAHHKGPPR